MGRRNRKQNLKAPSPVEIKGETEQLSVPAEIPAETPEPAFTPAPPAGADRRTHPRYSFTATAEVEATESGAWMKTRVSDLSRQGCYVDTDTPFPLETTTVVRITKGEKSLEARARVVYMQTHKGMGLMFTAVPPEHVATLDTWLEESRETSWLAANRRRSQRVLMKVPVKISAQSGTETIVEEETHTAAISVHGALIAVSTPVNRGQRLTLSNVQTESALECVVVHVARPAGGPIQLGVEFLLPNPKFWRVAFPPKDWTPRHPDAKSPPRTGSSH